MGYLESFSTILSLSILLSANTDGQYAQSNNPSEVDRTHYYKSPVGFGCRYPPAPRHGRVRCMLYPNEERCVGECFDGYQFPSHYANVLITCGRDSVLRPDVTFPACEPTSGNVPTHPGFDAFCDPPCQNGGKCIRNNVCGCEENFWGKYCESSLSVCNLRAARNVGYKCTAEPELLTCSLVCGENMQFEFSPASSYTCTPNGKWTPSLIPNCILNKPQPPPAYIGQPQTGDACEIPQAPANGRVGCLKSARTLICTGTCYDGYQFQDQSSAKVISCYGGISTPYAAFPNCHFVCNRPCQNGGTCIGPDVCGCPKDHWGKWCEASASTCNLQETHLVGYACAIKNNVKICTLACGKGMVFEFQPASSYSCSPTGVWAPSRIPNCTPDNPAQIIQGSYGVGSAGPTQVEGGVVDCASPPAPANGRMSCRRNSQRLICTGTCYEGYKFYDQSINKEISCGIDKTLRPTATFPNCEPICSPRCENGGTCVGPNTCHCADDYWGKSCKTPVSVCNLHETHQVGYECKIKSDVMLCTLTCPKETKFEFTPAPSYSCTTAGKWTPSQIPNCVQANTYIKYKPNQRALNRGDQTRAKTYCSFPLVPVRVRVYCKLSSKYLTCTGKCVGGYQFPDRTVTKKIVCDRATGSPMPKKFPDCQRKI